jgi:hypothetical protein
LGGATRIGPVFGEALAAPIGGKAL